MPAILPEISRVYSEYLLQPRFQDNRPSVHEICLSAPIAKFSFDCGRPWSDQTPHMLNLAFMSAAMQSVSGPKLAEELAKAGGLATIYSSQSVEDEARMVKDTKRVKGGFVVPYTISPDMTIGAVIQLSKNLGFDKYPVTENGKPDGRLVGLLTEDLYTERHRDMPVKDRMILPGGMGNWPYDRLERYIASESEVGGDLKKANEIMLESAKSRVLLIIDKNDRLKSAVFRRDIEEHMRHHDTELVDEQHRYKVAAAINTRDYKERVPALMDAGADYLVIDSSQGHTAWQAETLRWIRKEFGEDAKVISGNFVTPEGFDFAVENGADAVKIGIGPGSICITRTRFGGGCGQATAVMEIAKRRDAYFKETGIYVPIIADGGIVTTSDIMIAHALDADIVMMGRFFSGYRESPTGDPMTREIESKDGGKFLAMVKPYWGEGSERAKQWRKGRYDQAEFAEGVEGFVPYKGRFSDTFPMEVLELKTGIHKFGYTGIKDLQDNARLRLQSEGSAREGKPHDVYGK